MKYAFFILCLLLSHLTISFGQGNNYPEKCLTNHPGNDRYELIAYVTSMENSRPEIYVMNKKGKKQKRITWNEDGETLPTWSPDGKRLLITAYRDGNYELCELDLSRLNNR